MSTDTTRERERRRRQRERLRRRRRRRRIAAAAAGAVVLLGLVFVVWTVRERMEAGKRAGESGDIIVLTGSGAETAAGLFGEGPGEVRPDVAAGGETALRDGEDGSADPAAGEGNPQLTYVPSTTVQLTEGQKHTGDLILVSSSFGYDFEANEETIHLVRIGDSQSWTYPVDKEEFMVARHIMKSLDAMSHDCDQTMGTNETGISSAYRSMEYQQNVWDEAEEEYGEDYAKSYVATPGYSEHHTGLSVDLGIFYDDGSYGSFTGSENAAWMASNCWKYGFIRRYAEDKTAITGISNESWHFRYVGLPHSAYMAEHNLCLEEYLDFLKSSTSAVNPLVYTCEGTEYSIYCTSESVIQKPAGRFEISGDNRGNYIVTVSG